MQVKSSKLRLQTHNGYKKHLIETILCLAMMPLYSLCLFYLHLREKLFKKKMYFYKTACHNKEVSYFNLSNSLLKSLPLLLLVIKKELDLVGIYLYSKQQIFNEKPGLISLFSLKSQTNISHDSQEKTNLIYLKERSCSYDLKLMLRFFISCLFTQKRTLILPFIKLFNVSFNNINMQEAISIIKEAVIRKEKTKIYFLNADTANKAYKDKDFANLLNQGTHVFADGIGLQIACNILKTPLKQNINGTDMLPFICKMAQVKGFSIFLYGAQVGVAKRMAEILQQKYSGLKIAGTCHGFEKNNSAIIEKINTSKAEILLVAKGAPIQEEWIHTYAVELKTPVIIGVGGLFDFYSKNKKRAPQWLREIGMEWAFRLFIEPKRLWKRYIIGNPIFLKRVLAWSHQETKRRLKKRLICPSQELSINFDFYKKALYYTYPLTKRALDLCVSTSLLLLLLPLFTLVALAIKFQSKGDIFFSQIRVGKDGKYFKLYKFRSMYTNAYQDNSLIQNCSADGVIFKNTNDPRITSVGKFIRKWSIDELPQLLNVIKAEMSLVGPRPPIPSEVEIYNNSELRRLHVTPGITCTWQVSGRSEIPFKKQVKLDIDYISHRSLWLDTKILLQTLPAIITHKGAY